MHFFSRQRTTSQVPTFRHIGQRPFLGFFVGRSSVQVFLQLGGKEGTYGGALFGRKNASPADEIFV
jgi:hypothetical protein